MKIIISIFVYLVALTVFIVFGPLFVILSFFLSTQWLYRLSRFVSWAILKSFFIKLKIKGTPPQNGTYIYMFNHGSFIDPFLFGYAMKGPCTAVIAKENYNYPIWGSMLKRFKAIPIERKNKELARQSISHAEDALKSGYDVVILPEGTRTITGKLKRFKKGGFHMAYNTRVPIIPVGCIGAFEFKPKNRWILSPRTIIINYGDPTDPSTYELLGVDGLLKQIELEIKKLSNGKFEDEL